MRDEAGILVFLVVVLLMSNALWLSHSIEFKQDAIDAGAAQYDATTGEFEFKGKK